MSNMSGLIYLFDVYGEAYRKKHKLSQSKFKVFEKEHHIYEYITECRYIFNDITIEEGVKAIENYVK